MSSGNLKVCDNEYEELFDKYKTLGNDFEREYNCFVHCLELLTEQAITSGQTYNNLVQLLACTKEIKGKLSVSTELASQICSDFVYNIDEADRYLY